MPVGFAVDDWQGARLPDDTVLAGRSCRLEPLDLDQHSESLFDAYRTDTEGRNWVYLPYGPFESMADLQDWMSEACFNGDPKFYAIVDIESGRATGMASYLRINPDAGSIEVGHIHYSPELQGTLAATEAMHLMMGNAFALGYRRYEWKCNALNEKSRSAALRLGFSYEGIFRQMLVVKGRNRDSAWYSLLDREWPSIDQAFRRWLAPENFDQGGHQRLSLSVLTRDALAQLEETP